MKKKIALILATVMALTTLSACGSNEQATITGPAPATEASAAPATGTATETEKKPESRRDTTTLAMFSDVASFMPTERVTDGDTITQDAIFMPLFRYAFHVVSGEFAIISEACDSWEISDDAKTYTFHVKDGISFHNGEPLSISDVVYSVNLTKETPGAMTWSLNIDSVEATDDNTVVITLLEPNSEFMQVAHIPLLHEKTYTEAGDDFRNNPIGCGPYQYVSRVAGYSVTLKAFDDYILGKPYFENMIFRVVAEPTVNLMVVESGDVDAARFSLFNELENIVNNDDLTVHINPLGHQLMVMNHNLAPFDDVNVRLAINYAINKERVNEVYYAGMGVVPTSHIPWIQDERLVGYPYNVEKAKEHLALAGYPGGEGFPTITMETFENFRDFAQIIQNNLRDIGITMEIELGEATTLASRLGQGEVPLSFIGLGLGVVPSAFSRMLVTGGSMNFSGYSNPEVDSLMKQASSEMDDAKRHELYVEACLILERDAVYGLTAYQLSKLVVRSELDTEYLTVANYIIPAYLRDK